MDFKKNVTCKLLQVWIFYLQSIKEFGINSIGLKLVTPSKWQLSKLNYVLVELLRRMITIPLWNSQWICVKVLGLDIYVNTTAHMQENLTSTILLSPAIRKQSCIRVYNTTNLEHAQKMLSKTTTSNLLQTNRHLVICIVRQLHSYPNELSLFKLFLQKEDFIK